MLAIPRIDVKQQAKRLIKQFGDLRGILDAPFRYDKTIEADDSATHPDYPSVIAVWGGDRRDEANRLAGLVEFLKEKKVIADYSQVALLLHSVREEHSGPYLTALDARGIPAFCPRARAYFDIPVTRPRAWSFRSSWPARSVRSSQAQSRSTATSGLSTIARPSSRRSALRSSIACDCITSPSPGRRRFSC